MRSFNSLRLLLSPLRPAIIPDPRVDDPTNGDRKIPTTHGKGAHSEIMPKDDQNDENSRQLGRGKIYNQAASIKQIHLSFSSPSSAPVSHLTPLLLTLHRLFVAYPCPTTWFCPPTLVFGPLPLLFDSKWFPQALSDFRLSTITSMALNQLVTRKLNVIFFSDYDLWYVPAMFSKFLVRVLALVRLSQL